MQLRPDCSRGHRIVVGDFAGDLRFCRWIEDERWGYGPCSVPTYRLPAIPLSRRSGYARPPHGHALLAHVASLYGGIREEDGGSARDRNRDDVQTTDAVAGEGRRAAVEVHRGAAAAPPTEVAAASRGPGAPLQQGRPVSEQQPGPPAASAPTQDDPVPPASSSLAGPSAQGEGDGDLVSTCTICLEAPQQVCTGPCGGPCAHVLLPPAQVQVGSPSAQLHTDCTSGPGGINLCMYAPNLFILLLGMRMRFVHVW